MPSDRATELSWFIGEKSKNMNRNNLTRTCQLSPTSFLFFDQNCSVEKSINSVHFLNSVHFSKMYRVLEMYRDDRVKLYRVLKMYRVDRFFDWTILSKKSKDVGESGHILGHKSDARFFFWLYDTKTIKCQTVPCSQFSM